jgi:hypothetical protein
VKFPKFPKKIYVKVEQDGDETYLVASEDPSDLMEKGVAVPAAEFSLSREGVVIEESVTVKYRD